MYGFQPLMKERYQWTSIEFSKIQSICSGAGFAVTTIFTLLARKRLISATQQASIGALFFSLGAGLMVIPPVSEYRLILAWFMGFFAQIVFSGPWNVVYGQIMTKDHIS